MLRPLRRARVSWCLPVQRHVRLSLVDGRVVLVGFHEIHLRDQHNRPGGALSLEEARRLFEAEPEPQRTSNLEVLARQHGPARVPRAYDL